VSLEVDLKGHGEVPLSYPRAATSHIELPASLEGKTLVEDKRARSVVAETYKAKGAAVRIAVAPGDYRVLVRQGTTLSRCEVSGGGIVELSRCTKEDVVDATPKGAGYSRPSRTEYQFFVGGERSDGYTSTLEAFGYKQDFMSSTWGSRISHIVRLSKYLWVGGAVGAANAPNWKRDSDGLYPLRFTWDTVAISGVGRVETPFGEQGFLSRLKVYGQLDVGLGLGRTTHYDQDDTETNEVYAGPSLQFGTGLLIGGDDNKAFWRGVGLSLGYQLEYAPIIDNLIGDTHASGGHRAAIAVSFSY
jgi:hypothetical protein